MKWQSDPLGYYGGFHTKISLRNGQVLWVGVDDSETEKVYRPGILILSDPDSDMWDRDYDWEWRKGAENDIGGTAIGPGGTEAFALAGAALREAEDLLPSGSMLVVGAATERLFRVYERFLSRRGYTRVAGELVKVLD